MSFTVSTLSQCFGRVTFLQQLLKVNKNTLQKQTVAAMNHGNEGIPPFAFLLVLLIKWGFFAPTTFKKHTVTVEVFGWRFVSVRVWWSPVLLKLGRPLIKGWGWWHFFSRNPITFSWGVLHQFHHLRNAKGKFWKIFHSYHSQKVSKGLTICESFFCHWWVGREKMVFFFGKFNMDMFQNPPKDI